MYIQQTQRVSNQKKIKKNLPGTGEQIMLRDRYVEKILKQISNSKLLFPPVSNGLDALSASKYN